MRKYGLRDRARYRFDNFMARGTSALILALAALSLVFVLIGGAAVVALALANGDTSYDFPEALWASLMRTMDAGGMGGDEGWGFRAVMLVVTIAGIFIFSAFIGVLTAGLESRLEGLRKGRSPVIERGHTVVLGWTAEIFSILEQLALANSSAGGGRVAILADMDKVEMEAQIAARVGEARGTKFICRSGSPIDLDDVALMNLGDAKGVIILSEGPQADSSVIKALLAAAKNGLSAGAGKAAVAQVRDRSFLQPARIASGGAVVPILVDEVIPRVVAQACRQSGLSNVYVELLDFQGSEIYFADAPSLVGRTFREAVLAFEDCAAIGLVRPDGTAAVNPPMDSPIGESWRVIVIAQDDDRIAPLAAPAGFEESLIERRSPAAERTERFVVLGWNRRVPAIVAELDSYVAPGSSIRMLGAAGADEARAALAEGAPALARLEAAYETADITSREALEAAALGDADHVIVMCEDGSFEAETADSRTLVTLIHVRDIARKRGSSFSLTSQILDTRNRALAEAAEADDFIVSDRILSLLAAQLSENPRLAPVLDDLFDPEGSEIYIKSAADYVRLGAPVDFFTVAESCARKGQCAIGYRIAAKAKDASSGYGIAVNPRKSERIVFGEGDGIVLLADE
jgi:ion channel POLLUX/CASTOR